MGISKPSQAWAKHQKDMAVLYSPLNLIQSRWLVSSRQVLWPGTLTFKPDTGEIDGGFALMA